MALQKKLKRKGQKTEGRKKHNVTKTQPQKVKNTVIPMKGECKRKHDINI